MSKILKGKPMKRFYLVLAPLFLSAFYSCDSWIQHPELTMQKQTELTDGDFGLTQVVQVRNTSREYTASTVRIEGELWSGDELIATGGVLIGELEAGKTRTATVIFARKSAKKATGTPTLILSWEDEYGRKYSKKQ